MGHKGLEPRVGAFEINLHLCKNHRLPPTVPSLGQVTQTEMSVGAPRRRCLVRSGPGTDPSPPPLCAAPPRDPSLCHPHRFPGALSPSPTRIPPLPGSFYPPGGCQWGGRSCQGVLSDQKLSGCLTEVVKQQLPRQGTCMLCVGQVNWGVVRSVSPRRMRMRFSSNFLKTYLFVS